MPLTPPPALPTGLQQRAAWLTWLERLARPVLAAAARHELKARLPVEHHPDVHDRASCTHLEAVGRTLAGVAPWLEHGPTTGPEGAQRAALHQLALATLDAITDPASPDFINFDGATQPQVLVDAAFLAQALLRAPQRLWHDAPAKTQAQLLAAFQLARRCTPGFNNWLLFAATVEAALCHFGQPWDGMRVDYALRQHEQWYLGDGIYSDGPRHHCDYYNSFVIHPMLLDVLRAVAPADHRWDAFHAPMLARAQRHALVLERHIAPDGSFPALGRSLTYRAGVFHLPAQLALHHQLPPDLPPNQLRPALSAVLHRTLSPPATFTGDGWLQIGLCGHQPSLGERYISTGSLYLCTAVFLPLGLPADDPFWAGPDIAWTNKRIWGGEDAHADHALTE